MARIVAAKSAGEFKLHLRFDNGVEGTVDLSRLVGRGVFAAWSQPGVFESVAIDQDFGTVEWPGGIDLCPDSLYAQLTGVPIGGEPA
ncbi:MAG: DUF2442 domain-containing protein [Candidatus Sericytochromatia bacterium]|nr:DUF2442 domain-containing protein [Candidatus Tanganyikabacteria bacterium]